SSAHTNLYSFPTRRSSDLKDVFPDELPPGLPPVREVDHRIELIPDSQPVYRSMYRMSPGELDEMKKQLDQLLTNGFVRPSKSPRSEEHTSELQSRSDIVCR